MTGRRLTTVGLLALVAMAALVMAAWMAATFDGALAVLAVVVLSLQASVILAVVRPGNGRPFWLGFTLCGLPYLVAGMPRETEYYMPMERWIVGIDPSPFGGHVDVTGNEVIIPEPREQGMGISRWPTATHHSLLPYGFFASRMSIAHSAVTILVAVAGGVFFVVPGALVRRWRPVAIGAGVNSVEGEA